MRYLSPPLQARQRRSGMILLVVMAMLALFASVALGFVFYADNEAIAAKMHRDSFTKIQADVDPEELASYFLSQFIYDTDNIYSAMRGWSLSRSIHGYNPAVLNFTPYNGIGRSALSYPVTFGGSTFDNFNMVNYTKYDGDPLRNPEWYGKSGDANFRYVGGANPPWTAYDTNSLFLAQVDAGGRVTMPSYYRPWHAQGAPAAAAKYASLSPDSGWNPQFALPDIDASGNHVKNLEYGPGGNDSRWIDLGYPVMTAPNGKRYKVLFAPLVVDMANKLHLWAHGNRLGVSNQGLGPTDVNLNRLPGMAVPITASGATEAGGTVTITTGIPHGLLKNQTVVISGVGKAGYNGIFTITNVPSPTSLQYAAAPGLTASGGGTVSSGEIFALRYGNLTGPPPNSAPKFWANTYGYSKLDADALDPATGLSSRPFSVGVLIPKATLSAAVSQAQANAGAVRTVTVPVMGTTNGFPWYFFDLVTNVAPATMVLVDQELVTVTAVSVTAGTFTATFRQPHASVQVPVAVNPNFGFPTYPSSWAASPSWGNASAAELTNNPLGFNLFNPAGTNIAPLPMSHQEALLRFGGTNSPALTSEIFRRMPALFGNPRARMMVTMANWHIDRVTGAPFLNNDRTTGGHYVLTPANKYPQLVAGSNPVAKFDTPSSVKTSDSTTNPPWKTEFSTDWRSNLGNFLRVDLNRPLTDYTASATQALADRQRYARDIYNALIRVTGACDPNNPNVAQNMPTRQDYQAARWLAQLAVNMVDYIDNDSYITAFPWHKDAKGNPVEYVFGTELPRVVMNEVYAQQEAGPSAQVNVWAELLNPLPNVPANNVVLQLGGNRYYEIEIYASTPALTAWLRDPANNSGAGFPSVPAGTVPPLTTQLAWVPSTTTAQTTALTTQVLPAGAAPQISTHSIAPASPNVGQTGASIMGVNVTIHTTQPHGLTSADVGKAITITGVMDASQIPVPIVGYDGTFVITGVVSPSTIKYTVPAGTGNLAHGGGGTATFVTNANSGFYVVGPAAARYASANRVPNLPATLASNGMTLTPPSATIKSATIKGNLVTITINAPLPAPAAFVAGQKVLVGGVADAAYNNSTASPFWTIEANPAPTATSFSYRIANPLPKGDSKNGIVSLPIPQITMLLRRLANPSVPYNAVTNPYVTVDYLDQIPVNLTPAGTVGRPQPYQSSIAVAGPNVVGANSNFFQHNVPGGAPFDWLVHLDRPPVNPLELLHVSGFKPHELTQQFVVGANKFQHYAPWNPFMAAPTANTNALIYRGLDSMSTRYMAGLYVGGRIPGNINLNTIMDPEVFLALCDPHDASALYPNPWFTVADVRNLLPKLFISRGTAPGNASATEPTTPFKSFSAGSINDTWLRPDPSNPARPLFAVGNNANHPYVQSSLLQKIYNNITTTSNVFGVWWTAGFFEVVDETVKPVKLGKEIGRDENRHIRHRFFALVDRSALQLFSARSAGAVTISTTGGIPQTLTMSITPPTVATTNGSTNGAVRSFSPAKTYAYSDVVTFGSGTPPVNRFYFCIQPPPVGTAPTNAAYWQPLLQPGMLLEIDAGTPSAEVVAIQTVTNNGFTAAFTKSHAASATISCRGNPGPQHNYNPHRDNSVVLHMSVIQ
jgi:hypothetical protein